MFHGVRCVSVLCIYFVPFPNNLFQTSRGKIPFLLTYSVHCNLPQRLAAIGKRQESRARDLHSDHRP
jgi:hypothetical protein